MAAAFAAALAAALAAGATLLELLQVVDERQLVPPGLPVRARDPLRWAPTRARVAGREVVLEAVKQDVFKMLTWKAGLTANGHLQQQQCIELSPSWCVRPLSRTQREAAVCLYQSHITYSVLYDMAWRTQAPVWGCEP